jgi:transposase
VTVAHPLAVKLISAARVKTDARDTIKLARLLAANLIPSVWVPPLVVRELRALIAHRKRLVKQRTQARNRLHGVLQRHNLIPPQGKTTARENAQLVACLTAFCFRVAPGPARSHLVRSTRSVDR